jgi:hypothetical protein
MCLPCFIVSWIWWKLRGLVALVGHVLTPALPLCWDSQFGGGEVRNAAVQRNGRHIDRSPSGGVALWQ